MCLITEYFNFRKVIMKNLKNMRYVSGSHVVVLQFSSGLDMRWDYDSSMYKLKRNDVNVRVLYL